MSTAAASPPELAAQLAAGESAMSAGRHQDAARAFETVSNLLPQDLGVARLAAAAWQLAGRRARARAVLQRSLAVANLAATTDTVAYELAALCLDVGAPAEALTLLEVVARSRPGHPAMLGAMASAHRALGALDQAWRLAEQAVAKDRKNPALLLTAAQVRHAQLRFDEALAWLKKAEAVRPLHGPTRMQRALTRLIQGPTRHGWEDFEHRGVPPLPSGCSWWRGEALAGRSIRVLMEQGVGDLFHFVRFVPLLVERGAGEVVLEAPESTLSLMQASGLPAFAPGAGPATELAVPLLSLPLRLGTEGETLAGRVPYLRTSLNDAPHKTSGEHGLAENRPLRLGLIPSGNPDFLATNLRDLDQPALAALLELPDVQWTWLLPDKPPIAGVSLDVPQLSYSWFDTAVLMSQLDGAVSVDTGGAHLAGALGLPTLVLLPYTPDWRWGPSGERSAWYPSMRLLRESTPASWPAVVARVQELLALWRRETLFAYGPTTGR